MAEGFKKKYKSTAHYCSNLVEELITSTNWPKGETRGTKSPLGSEVVTLVDIKCKHDYSSILLLQAVNVHVNASKIIQASLNLNSSCSSITSTSLQVLFLHIWTLG